MLILFFIFSLLILFSTLGYGLITIRLLKFEKLNLNCGIIGIFGLFLLSIVSIYSHLLFPHNQIHNLIVIFFGILSLFLLKKKKFFEIKYLSIIFILLFISILMSKTNEDFGYYHLPNSLQFAQQKLQFGLGNLNHGFKHISSLFMLMSLTYLPIFKFYLFNLTNLLFLTFFITFLLIEIYQKKNVNLNISTILLSLFLILFLGKFARLAEYGSDLSGQIVISIYIFYILEFFYNKKINQEEKLDYLKISLLLIIFGITLKFISVIYSLLYLIFFYLINDKKFYLFNLIKLNFLILAILPLIGFIFLNFSATGCLIYPVEQLCFSEKFDWALSSEVIKYLKFHYEIWSKGGITPNFSVENQENYLSSLNWVTNWFSTYFFGKFSDYLLVNIILILIFTLFFIKDIFFLKLKNKNEENSYLIFYIILITIFLLWFFNFPSLRYAGYIVVFLLLIFPYAIYISKSIDLSKKENMKKLSIIFLISYSIFLIKNVDRLINEFNISEVSHHNFKNFPFFWIDEKDFKEQIIDDHKVFLTKGACWAVPSTCIKNVSNLKIKKKNNYIFYLEK